MLRPQAIWSPPKLAEDDLRTLKRRADGADLTGAKLIQVSYLAVGLEESGTVVPDLKIVFDTSARVRTLSMLKVKKKAEERVRFNDSSQYPRTCCNRS